MKKGLALGLLLLVVLTGCTGGQQPAKVSEVKIGALYPLSGAQAPTGLDMKNGVELAIDIVNNKYPDLDLPLAATEGLPNLGGAKIKVIYGDHQAVPEKGMSEAERLYQEEKVVAVVGCYNSGVTATASQVAERLQKPFLNPDSVSPSLIKRGFKWFFRLTPDDEMFAENMFKFLDDLKNQKGQQVKTVAIINENTLWGQDFANVAKALASKYGYQVVEHLVYPAKTSEVASEVQKLKNANPDVVLQASYISDAILFMKTYKQQNYMPKGLLANAAGFVDAAFVETLGKDADYVITRSVWSEDLAEKKPIVKKVNELYKSRYGVNMNENSARAFMGALVLADAINRAKSTDPAAIRQALLDTNIPASQIILAWEGIKFNPENGQNVLGRAVMVQIQDGKYYTVWPFDLASKELVWPIQAWSERK